MSKARWLPAFLFTVACASSCASSDPIKGDAGSTGSGGAGGSLSGAGGTGGGSGGTGPGTGGTGGTTGPGTGGAGPGGQGGGVGGAGGAGTGGQDGGAADAGRGGSGGAGGAGGRGGTGGTGGGAGGTGGTVVVAPLDCGARGTPLENNGPPSNRANYVIVADGYSQAELAAGGTLDKHLQAMLTKRFNDPIGQPYLRYRKFVNICVLRIPSTPICGSSVFGCCGDTGTRLANCNTTAVTNGLRDNLPASFEADWRSVVLNGSSWWNSGGAIMLFSGGNAEAGGAALHEGGHGFHSLSDEYGNCEQGRVSREATYGVNVSLASGNSGGKWEGWLGYSQTPGTGAQGFNACDGGATWRPSQNSMMNSLFCNGGAGGVCNPNTSFNPVSREKIVMDIWRAVAQPWDSVEPPAGAVTNPAMLKVNVIDPAVINVDWSVDGAVVGRNGGPTFAIAGAGLASGTHTVAARAYDNAGMDLVRQVPGTTFNRQYWGSGVMGHSDKTVTWTVTIP